MCNKQKKDFELQSISCIALSTMLSLKRTASKAGLDTNKTTKSPNMRVHLVTEQGIVLKGTIPFMSLSVGAKKTPMIS
jgi:hypothetical protein